MSSFLQPGPKTISPVPSFPRSLQRSAAMYAKPSICRGTAAVFSTPRAKYGRNQSKLDRKWTESSRTSVRGQWNINGTPIENRTWYTNWYPRTDPKSWITRVISDRPISSATAWKASIWTCQKRSSAGLGGTSGCTHKQSEYVRQLPENSVVVGGARVLTWKSNQVGATQW